MKAKYSDYKGRTEYYQMELEILEWGGDGMIVCKDCYIPMVSVVSFSKDKHEKFCRCPKCSGETNPQKIRDDELTFGEVLDKAINKKVGI